MPEQRGEGILRKREHYGQGQLRVRLELGDIAKGAKSLFPLPLRLIGK